MLGTGERLPFDRLILATGSEAFLPEIAGFGRAGTFVLRTASDALGVREYVQQAGAQTAVVAGGGLLGLEAAYALHKLGLRTTVLERSALAAAPPARRARRRAAARLSGEPRHRGRWSRPRRPRSRTAPRSLADGRRLPADVVLVAAGIAPSAELARHAGLEVQRGVLVDDHLRTSDPRIFAAGDLAEWRGSILGLWPVAVEQAEVAAENAVGGSRPYAGTVPVTMLKVVGVELLSIGAIDGPRELADADPDALRYRKLVLDEEGRAIGGILLGHPEHVQTLTAAVRESRPMSGWS